MPSVHVCLEVAKLVDHNMSSTYVHSLTIIIVLINGMLTKNLNIINLIFIIV